MLNLDEPEVAAIYGKDMILVRPDQHIAWRGRGPVDRRDAAAVLSRILGHGLTTDVPAGRRANHRTTDARDTSWRAHEGLRKAGVPEE